MFENLSLQMDFPELTMQVALLEACFQAASANECYEHLQLLAEPGGLPWKISICEALQMLSRDQLELRTRVWFSTLDPLNLFALVSGTSPGCENSIKEFHREANEITPRYPYYDFPGSKIELYFTTRRDASGRIAKLEGILGNPRIVLESTPEIRGPKRR